MQLDAKMQPLPPPTEQRKYYRGLVYTVTTLLIKNGSTHSSRTPILCSSYGDAETIILKDGRGLEERLYNYVVVEPVRLDNFYSLDTSKLPRAWFRWIEKKNAFQKMVKPPKCMRRTINFCIG